MKYRPDIDGLRAIAIIAVVFYHAFPRYMAGGFIGVDVFFVISGYLISSILIEKLDAGRFSFIEFYAHRIKRILPGLVLVLFVCVGFGWFALLTDEYAQLGSQVAGAAAFISNYVLLSEAGYFNNLAETKPLLHLWSLAIEEQFYVAWPLVLWVFWRIRYGVQSIILIAILGSYYLNIKETNLDPSKAFYLPQARFFEIIFGAFLAWIQINKNNIPIYSIIINENVKKVICNTFSILGFAILIYGFFELDKTFEYPGQWAVIPVFGTLLIIFAGPKCWINSFVLSNKPIVYIGLISYSLYLWHWPLLSFFRIVNGETPGDTDATIIIFISLIFSILTYHFIERPLRKNKRAFIVPFLIGSLLVLGTCGYVIEKENGFPKRMEVYELNKEQRIPPQMTENAAYCKSFLPNYTGDCVSSHKNVKFTQFDYVFFGDSHARALSMDYILNPNRLHSLLLGKNGCPPLSGVDRFNYRNPYLCEKNYDETLNIFKSHDFENSTLIYTMYFTAYYNGDGVSPDGVKYISNGGVHIQPSGEWQEGSYALYSRTFSNSFDKTLIDLAPLFRRIVIVLQPPELLVAADKCVERPFRRINDGCHVPKDAVLSRQAEYREAIFKSVARYKNIIVYDPINDFCDLKFCYAIPINKMLYRDDNHIGMLGSKVVLNGMVSEINRAVNK